MKNFNIYRTGIRTSPHNTYFESFLTGDSRSTYFHLLINNFPRPLAIYTSSLKLPQKTTDYMFCTKCKLITGWSYPTCYFCNNELVKFDMVSKPNSGARPIQSAHYVAMNLMREKISEHWLHYFTDTYPVKCKLNIHMRSGRHNCDLNKAAHVCIDILDKSCLKNDGLVNSLCVDRYCQIVEEGFYLKLEMEKGSCHKIQKTGTEIYPDTQLIGLKSKE